MDINTIVCSKLALERCINYVNQIQAVIYLCSNDDDSIGKTATDNLQRIVALLGGELEASAKMLVLPDDQADRAGLTNKPG